VTAHSRQPQLLLTLAPDGTLQVELPGAMATRRVVPVRDRECASTLKRMLEAQARSDVAIGEDGSPTQAQVRHWERHGVFGDPRCPHCISEGFRPRGSRVRAVVIAEHGGVVVRRVPARKSGLPKAPAAVVATAKKSPSEMGL
jgi:hypothetical protein